MLKRADQLRKSELAADFARLCSKGEQASAICCWVPKSTQTNSKCGLASPSLFNHGGNAYGTCQSNVHSKPIEAPDHHLMSQINDSPRRSAEPGE